MGSRREKATVNGQRRREDEVSSLLPFSFSIIFFLLLSLAACLFFSIGCEQSFQPLKESTRYAFSIYGYLDATADTQWVRVIPAREQLATDTIPEMTVTLEELETGHSTTLNDSLFTLPNGIRFVNVWTTMDIKPRHTYRLLAERPDGTTSSATVSTPADFPVPELTFPYNDCRGRVDIKGVKRLADVQWVFYYKINSSGYLRERLFRFPQRNRADSNGQNEYHVLLDRDKEKIPLPAGEIVKSKRTVFVAAGGPEWNGEISLFDDLLYALPETASNIQNGVGYLVGIVSKTIPFECP